MKPPVQLFVPRNRVTMSAPRYMPMPFAKSCKVVGVGAKVLVSCEMPPAAMRMGKILAEGQELLNQLRVRLRLRLRLGSSGEASPIPVSQAESCCDHQR